MTGKDAQVSRLQASLVPTTAARRVKAYGTRIIIGTRNCTASVYIKPTASNVTRMTLLSATCPSMDTGSPDVHTLIKHHISHFRHVECPGHCSRVESYGDLYLPVHPRDPVTVAAQASFHVARKHYHAFLGTHWIVIGVGETIHCASESSMLHEQRGIQQSSITDTPSSKRSFSLGSITRAYMYEVFEMR